MSWLFELHKTQPIAHAIGALSFVCVLGMALGSLKFRGIGLGTAGVLFAGIVLGHFGEPVDHPTLAFVKEFGLVLFVFTIGRKSIQNPPPRMPFVGYGPSIDTLLTLR